MELTVTIDGVKYTHTESSLAELIKLTTEQRKERDNYFTKWINAKETVKSFFQERFDEDTDASELTISIEDINNLLKDIGEDVLSKEWSGEFVIRGTFEGLKAASREEAQEILEGEYPDVSFSLNYDSPNFDSNVDSVEVSYVE
jgi:hypothetical protein